MMNAANSHAFARATASAPTIISARISRLVYGATDARAGAVESIFNIPGHPSLAPAPKITAGMMEDECKALLREFFAARR